MNTLRCSSLRWCRRTTWRLQVLICALLVLCRTAEVARAHEGGHDDLPSTGVAVHGDRVILSPAAAESLRIRTEVVHLKTLEHDVTANASVEVPWRQHAYATSLVAGRISRVLVQPGDVVERGQELAEVESAEIETLQTDLLNAAAELELATHLVEQRTGLAEAGSISDRRLLESQSTRDGWAAALSIAYHKLLSLGMRQPVLDEVLKSKRLTHNVPITSPVRGVVSVAAVRAGQVVEPWQQVYEIVDMSSVWVHGQVLESESTEVDEGQPVEIHVDAVPNRLFKGVVGHVGVKLDPELRSMHVHVEVDNPDGLLREGMFARMLIHSTVVPEAIACPVDAVFEAGGKSYVLVLERSGVYVRQPVKLGLRSGGFVEVLDGVFPGDPVVVVGKQELSSLFTPQSAADQPLIGSGSNPLRSATADTAKGEHRTVVAQGQIELPTNKKAVVYSTVTGRIAEVLVEHGQPVRAGDVLAEVDSLDLRNVQLDLLQAHSRLKLADTLHDRYGRLLATGAVPQRDYWQAEADVEKLTTTIEGLRNKLGLMGLSSEEIKQIERVDITDKVAVDKLRTTFEARAPIDGRITVFDLSIGQVVRPQDELFEIHDLGHVVVRGYIYEQDAADVQVGQQATVTITADPKFSAVGRVSRTAPTLSAFGRAMSVWVDLDNPDRKLKEGMLARLAIDTTPASKQAAPTQTAEQVITDDAPAPGTP